MCRSKQRDLAAKLDEAAKDLRVVVLPLEPDEGDAAMGSLAFPCSVLPTTCFYSQVSLRRGVGY